MSERKGHRKLRLCSNKYYEKKKYWPKLLTVSIPRKAVSILRVSIPLNLLSLHVSLPISAYTGCPISSLEVLYHRLQCLGTILNGWNHCIHGGNLTLYQLSTKENGPIIGLSLMIKEDYSWIVSYRNEVVSTECCVLLQNTPAFIDSVDKMSQLILILNTTCVCEGNSDDSFTSLSTLRQGTMMDQSRTNVVARLDSARTGVLSVYHARCEILIESSLNPLRCRSCKKQRRSLSAISSRTTKDDRTNPSSHTTYSCLTAEEKDERLRRLHCENKIAKLQVSRLEKKIMELVATNGIQLDNGLHDDMKEIVAEATNEIHQSFQPNTFQRLFWDQQRRASSLNDSRSMKWHPLVVKWCLYLRHQSSKSYETLRKSGIIKLPSQRTLRDYTHYVETKIGFSAEVDQHLVEVADLSKDLNKYVTLVMDEMHVKEELVYDKHEGCLIGFVNLGSINNQLMEYEAALSQDTTDRPLASSMLVLMVRGLFQKLNYPYAQFACANLSGDQMFDPVWQAVSRLERLGFYVLALTCDGATPNRKLLKLHAGKGDGMVYKVPNPYANDSRWLYFISDPPHLLKTIRNCLFNSKRKLWCNNKDISWKHIEDLYLRDTSSPTGPRLVPTLKYEHVYITSFSKMRVDLAAQALSERVANALERTGGEEVTETVRFIRMVDKFFDCLNVTNFGSGIRKKKSFQEPYRRRPEGDGTDDFRLKWLKEEFLPYLLQWEKDVAERTGFNDKEKAMMVLTNETRLGIRMTVLSFLELVEYIFTIPGVTVFLSERLSQDTLENYFGCQRQRGKSHENPNVLQFCDNHQALRVINGTCATVSKGNCRGSKNVINWEQENRPLPKRRRCKLDTTDPDKLTGTENVVQVEKEDTTEKSTVTVLQCPSITQVKIEDVTEKSFTTDQNGCLNVIQDVTEKLVSAESLAEVEHLSMPSDAVSKRCCRIEVTESGTDQKQSSAVISMDSQHILTHQETQPCAMNRWVDIVKDSAEEIEKALGPGNADEVMSKAFRISVKRSDCWTLRNGEWLNDQIVNFYFSLITGDMSSVFAFNTFFYLKLLSSTDYSGVRRWVNRKELLNKDLILVPIHMGAHWCLATVDFRFHQFCYYDSLLGDNGKCLQLLKDYMGHKFSSTTFSNWPFVFCKDIPQQLNGSDCGIFMCMYARHLSERTPFLFTQSDINVIRKLIVIEVLNKKLL